MKLKTLKSLVAAAFAAVGLNANSAQVEYTAAIGDETSEPCVNATSGAKDNAGQFANDKSASQGKNYDLVQIGDSVTENWGTTGIEGKYSKLAIDPDSDGVICMGIGGNRTQNIIYRCNNGTLDGYTTKYFTVLCGVNNIYQKIIDEGKDPDDPKNVAEAVRVILNLILAKHEESKILLMPILPYAFKYQVGTTYQALYRKALRVRENTEEINDLIMNFVDNKRVFWVDVRKDFVTEYGIPDFDKFGGPGGSYDPNQCLHPNTKFAYQYFNQAVTNAMLKYKDVAAGTAQCTDPSLGLVTSEQKGFSTNETINLSGIYLGTDSYANRVTKYSVSYELDGGAKVVALSNQSATRNSFDIPNVALGEHTIVVYVTTAAGVTVSRTLKFIRYDGWMAEALGTDDSQVRTDGTLKYAYARGDYTLNDVEFTSASGKLDNDNIYWSVGSDGGGQSITGTSGDYASMLKSCWWATAGKHTVTLKQLTQGNKYLVQIFGCRNSDNIDGNVFIDESFQEKYTNGNFIKVHGTGWDRGGTLIGCFTAASSTKTFTICSDGNHAINAVQVRDLGASGYIPVSVVKPSIGSVSANVSGADATITISDVKIGTDDKGVDAGSYTVSYSLNGAAAVAALGGADQSAGSVSFTVEDLADADYNCTVTITTSAGKMATATTSFTVDAVPDPVDPSFSAAVSLDVSNATIKVSSVVLGTDEDCNEATKYSLSYALDDDTEVPVANDLRADSHSFAISNLVEGSHSCVVKMTTDMSTTVSKTLSFTVSSAGGGSVASTGWTAEILATDASTIKTDGTLKYAYRAKFDWESATKSTINGVDFTKVNVLDSSLEFSVDKSMTFADYLGEQSSSSYGTLMGQGFRNSGAGEYAFTLNSLEANKTYLVQLLMHHNGQYNCTAYPSGDLDRAIHFGGTDWACGGSLTHIFTASGTSYTFKITYSDEAILNGIQVRELGEGGSVSPSEDPDEPTVYQLSVPDKTGLSLVSVATNGQTITAVSGTYPIIEDSAVTVTFEAADGYEIVGNTYVSFTMTATMTLVDYPTVKSTSAEEEESDPETPIAEGWTVSAAADDGSSVCTTGEVVCACTPYSTTTINGVQFVCSRNASDFADHVVFDPAFSSWVIDNNSFGRMDWSGNGWLLLSGYVWDNSVSSIKITLKDLTPGTNYLFQAVVHNNRSAAAGQTVTAGGLPAVSVNGYGASLVYMFTATKTTQDLTINYSGADDHPINFFQLRKLGVGGGEEEEEEEEEDPVTPMEEGWTAIAMTANGSSVCTTGNLMYAYAMYDVTVNGVTFTGVGTGGISNENCVTAFTSNNMGTTPPGDTASGDYTKLLQYGWWKTVKDRDIVLNNLTKGKQYLVQLIGHRSDYTTGYGYISSYSDQHMRFGGTGYEYGGSLIGVFTATASSETITVSYNTQCYLNAIQVREIVASKQEDAGFTDWPTAAEIIDSMTAADLKITSGSFTDATVAELRKLSTWGKANGVTFGGTEVNALSFDEKGNPLNGFTKAYLLNCAESEVETDEPKFKFASITPGVVPSIDDSGYNGEAKVEGSAKLGAEASWEDADASKHYFFRARLIRKAE